MKIRKRNGQEQDFVFSKLTAAIAKCLVACGYTKAEETDNNEINPPTADELAEITAKKALAIIKKDYIDESDVVDVEDAQEACEQALASTIGWKEARAFDRYRVQHEVLRNLNAAEFCENTIEGYSGEPDASEFFDAGASKPDQAKENWHVKQNASVAYSLGGMILNNNERIMKAHWLNKFYDPEIKQAYQSGALHIHDLGMLAGYCAGWSLKTLIKEGLGGVEGKISAGPAKHLNVLCNQMVNFIGILQNEWAGAQAFSSVDTLSAPFIKADNLSYKQVKQAVQELLFGLNMPSRWGCQAPFSNVTIDWNVPDDMRNLPAVVGGVEQDFTYGDCQHEMDMWNKAFIELMIEGDHNGRGYAYPIPTYSITKDFDWSDTENNKLLFEMASKYGTPYFSNYVNSDMQPSDVRSMCCRLRLDLRELRKQNGGNFGAGENTGSIGVVTINMPRIAFLAEDEHDFFVRLEKLMDISARSLDIKRKVITKYMDMGMYPYTQRYLPQGFKNHFSTIGLVGMNEACLNANWIGTDMSHKEAYEWTEKVLNFMRNKLSDYQELYGNLFNLEATPAESTAYRFAKHDKEMYPTIITAGAGNEFEAPYYTNSSHLPVGYTDDVFDALDIQDKLQTKYTSGTVFHCFLGEKLPDWKAAANLVKTVTDNYKLPYFTLSPVYSVCADHGYLKGEQKICPICGRPTEVYARITGYYRPVKNFCAGKATEAANRKAYNIIGNAQPATAKMADAKEESTKQSGVQAAEENGIYLFTTKTCPNCKMVKASGALSKFEVHEIDAEDPSNLKMVEKFAVKGAPTLVVVKDGMAEKYGNASEIFGFAKSTSK